VYEEKPNILEKASSSSILLVNFAYNEGFPDIQSLLARDAKK